MFCGQATLDLTPYRCRLAVRHREEIQLERPLAKIELITTDVIKYLNKLEQMKSVRPAGIEDFTVQLVYTGYFPTGFNVVSNRPNEGSRVYNSLPFPLLFPTMRLVWLSTMCW